MATETALDFVESGYDGRSHTECAELEEAVEGFRDRCGNIAVPGFTAPKLLWVKKHEPEIFRRITNAAAQDDGDLVGGQLAGLALDTRND